VSRNRNVALAALLALLVVTATPATPAIAQDDLAVSFTVQTGEGTMDMKTTTSADNVRVDMNSPRGEMSMIWLPDSMLMIMHSQKMYMEFTKEMMDRMRQMMGAMGGQRAQESADDFDVTQWTFERTGNTDTINGWSCFEVAMTGPEGEKGALWMTEDIDVGLFESMSRMAERMSQGLGVPGMQNPMGRLRDTMAYAKAQGLPEGRVVRVVNETENVTITLGEVTHGPFGAETWAAPAGYTKQQMPMMPR